MDFAAEILIGIDIGTSGVKAVAINAQGRIISSYHLPYNNDFADEQVTEINPDIILDVFIRCVSQFTTASGKSPGKIGLSCAMHSLILLDQHHQRLTNAITWADNRAGNIARRIRTSAAAEMLYEETGTPLHAMSPLAKIIWLKENKPEIFRAARKFVSIKEYLWFRLFGVFEADVSIASASGLFDIHRLKWSGNALSLAGIHEDQLSNIVSAYHRKSGCEPGLARQMGIDNSTIFYIGSTDGCLANIGSFATKPNTAALTIGTSGAVRIISKQAIQNFAAMTFNYRLDFEHFVSGGPTNNGGVILRWFGEQVLHHKLGTPDDYSDLLNGVDQVEPGSNGLTFLPYLLGERSPYWNTEARGAFIGLSITHDRRHLTRSVLEGICLALYNISDSLGPHIDTLHVTGGFIHSKVWLQILADVFGKPLKVNSRGDASAYGAALLALFENDVINKVSFYADNSETIIPDLKKHQAYQHRFKDFRDLYQALEKHMRSS